MRYSVLSTQYSVLSTQCAMLGRLDSGESSYGISNHLLSTLDSRLSTLDSRPAPLHSPAAYPRRWT